MFSYQKRLEDTIGPGNIQGYHKPSRKRNLTDCLSLSHIEDNWMVHKDGSLSVGFEVTLYEEERLSGDNLVSLVHEFAAACKRLPVRTTIHKLDIYYESIFELNIPEEASFFYRESLLLYHQRPILAHRSYIFLRFASASANPISSFLGLGGKLFSHPFLAIDTLKQTASNATKEFIASTPTGLSIKQLDEPALHQVTYQCSSLCFNRSLVGFERSYHILPDHLAMGDYVKSVSMKTQADPVYCFAKNNQGSQGVTSPFMWRLSHHIPFPHIISQQIALIHDQDFRKSKSLELEYSAQLQLGIRVIFRKITEQQGRRICIV